MGGKGVQGKCGGGKRCKGGGKRCKGGGKRCKGGGKRDIYVGGGEVYRGGKGREEGYRGGEGRVVRGEDRLVHLIAYFALFLVRTFPDHNMFIGDTATKDSLVLILLMYVECNPAVGYCQGKSDNCREGCGALSDTPCYQLTVMPTCGLT